MNRPVSFGQVCYDSQPSNTIAAVDLSKLVWTGKLDDGGRALMERDPNAEWGVPGQDILAASPFEPNPESRLVVAMRAGNRIYGYWDRILFAVDIPNNSKRGKVSWTTTLPERPATMLAADERLFVASKSGTIYCFGGERGKVQHHRRDLVDVDASPLRIQVTKVLQKSQAIEGYCVVIGAKSPDLVNELLLQSKLRLIVLDQDEQRVSSLRRRFTDSDSVRYACCGLRRRSSNICLATLYGESDCH